MCPRAQRREGTAATGRSRCSRHMFPAQNSHSGSETACEPGERGRTDTETEKAEHPLGKEDRGPARGQTLGGRPQQRRSALLVVGETQIKPPTTTTAADKTMARPWSRGAVGQPPHPHDDGVTGLWNSSSEPPARHRTLEMLSERTASPPEPGHRSDGPGAPRLPGTAAHLAATSKAAEHGVPPARSPCAVLVFGLRGRHNFSNFIR